jgi:hypothetical protein
LPRRKDGAQVNRMDLNFPGLGEGEGLVERTFGADVYARLQAVKRKLDLENAFQINQNILRGLHMFDIGRRAKGSAPHNLKVTGSNPVPATKKLQYYQRHARRPPGRFCLCAILVNTWSTFCESPPLWPPMFWLGPESAVELGALAPTKVKTPEPCWCAPPACPSCCAFNQIAGSKATGVHAGSAQDNFATAGQDAPHHAFDVE